MGFETDRKSFHRVHLVHYKPGRSENFHALLPKAGNMSIAAFFELEREIPCDNIPAGAFAPFPYPGLTQLVLKLFHGSLRISYVLDLAEFLAD